MQKGLISLFFIALIVTGCGVKKAEKERLCSCVDLEQVFALFPKTSAEIENITEQIIARMDKTISDIDQVLPSYTNFHNTLRPYDAAKFEFTLYKDIFAVMAQLHENPKLAHVAQKQSAVLSDYQSQVLDCNVNLYNAFANYQKYGKDPHRGLPFVKHFLQKRIAENVHCGLDLPLSRRSELQQLDKEIMQLSSRYLGNISYDNRKVVFSKSDLKGLSSDFISSLKQDSSGNYVLSIDTETYNNVMQSCLVEETRKEYLRAFVQRGCPQNRAILQSLSQACNEFAQMLQFPNYIDYVTHNQLLSGSKKIQSFLWHMVHDLQKYDTIEFEKMIKDLPSSVHLTLDGKIKSWDEDLVISWYKKQHFSTNNAKIAEYFELAPTIDRLLDVFSQYFDIEFEKEKVDQESAWSSDLLCYRVFSLKRQHVLGYLFFDLFKREGKLAQNPYHMTVIPAIKDDCSLACVGASVVVANFNDMQSGKPVLLELSDVITLFHECGHALHALFGATNFVDFSGTNVGDDFIEIPSMVFERWLQDPDVLKKISSHYEDKKSLSYEQIEHIMQIQNFGKVSNLLHKLFFSLLALEMYKNQNDDSLHHRIEKIYKKVFKHRAYDKQLSYECSFSDLVNCGPTYYNGILSEVIAADIYNYMRPKGLFNAFIAREYLKDILVPGASQNSQDMLKRFLKRSYNTKAFMHEISKDYAV